MAEPQVTLSKESIDGLAESITRTLGGARSPGGAALASAGDSGGFSWMKSLGSAANTTTDNLIKLSTGSYRAADALQLVTQASSAFGPLAGEIGKMTGKLGNAAITVNDYGNSIGNSGMRLSNNIGLLEKATLGARMSLPELEGTVKNNSRSIAGLSSDMDKSGLLFLNTAKKVQESGLAYQLQATGMSSEEFGKILTLVAHNARAGDLTRESTQKQVIASAIKLATEFDNTARLTGISIDEQRKSLESQVKRKDVELAMMAMSETERAALEQNLAMTKRYGDTVQDATRIMALGGPANEEEQKVVASLSPEMQDAVRRMAEVQGTGKEADEKRELIRREMDNIVLRQQADKAGLTQAQYLMRSGDEQGKSIAAATLEQGRYAQILQKANIEAERQGMTRDQYIQAQLAKVGQERKAATEGTVAPESRVGVALNQSERLMKDTAAGAGVAFEKLNTSVGQTTTEFNTLNKALKPWTQEQMSRAPAAAAEYIKGKTGVTKTVIPEGAAAAAGAPTLKRQDGSFGATGKWIEDFGKGTPAILHGREGVITEKQFNDLFGAVNSRTATIKNPTPAPTNPPKITKKIVPDVKKPVAQPSKEPTTLFSTIEKQFNSIIGSINKSVFGSLNLLSKKSEPAAPQEKKASLSAVTKKVTTIEKPKISKTETNIAKSTEQQYSALINSLSALPNDFAKVQEKNSESLKSFKVEKQPLAFDKDAFSKLLSNQQLEKQLMNQEKLREPNEKLNTTSSSAVNPDIKFDEKSFSKILNDQPLIPKFSAAPVEPPLGGMISGLQSSLSMDIEKNKISMPKLEDFQSLALKMESAIPTSKEKSVETTNSTVEPAMNDVKDQLVQLNTVMSQLLSHTANMADNTEQQIRATRSLSGNMLA